MYEKELKFLENHIELIENKDWDYLYAAIKYSDTPYIPLETFWANICKIFANSDVDINIFELSDGLIERLCTGKYSYNGRICNTTAFWPDTLTTYKIPKEFPVVPADFLAYKNKLQEVKFEGNPTEIGTGAFSFCKNLTHIDLPASIQIIKASAFAMSGLKDFSPIHKCKIEQSAFFQCLNLESVDFTKIIDTIPNYAFNFCEKLKTVQIPSNIEHIKYLAFGNIPIEYLSFDTSDSITVEDFAFTNSKLDSISVNTDNFDDCYNFFERSNFMQNAFYTSLIDVVSEITGEILGTLKPENYKLRLNKFQY